MEDSMEVASSSSSSANLAQEVKEASSTSEDEVIFVGQVAPLPQPREESPASANVSSPATLAAPPRPQDHGPPTRWTEETAHVGDAGFPQLPWLMAPIRSPRDTSEQSYNKALQKTRGVVERTIGLLKSRFLCLARPGGELLYSPQKCSKIIMACIVLHNLCLQHRDSWDVEEEREPKVWQPSTSGQSSQPGRAARMQLISNYFAWLVWSSPASCRDPADEAPIVGMSWAPQGVRHRGESPRSLRWD
ncbi:uncharacterized protein ACMZJ9_001254 [Mantella aurantiaca]